MRRIAVDLRDVGRLDRGRVDSGNFEADVQDRQATATKIYDLSRDLTSCQRPEVSTLGGGISITIPRRLWGQLLFLLILSALRAVRIGRWVHL